jgi:hypothetical protein
MLTPAQAELIADGLVGANKRENANSHRARARTVPLVYRSSALRKLPPFRQAELMEQAFTTVSSRWSVLLTCCAWSLLSAAVLWSLSTYRFSNWSWALLILLPFGPPLGWHAYLVRRELGALLATDSSPESINVPEV